VLARFKLALVLVRLDRVAGQQRSVTLMRLKKRLQLVNQLINLKF
jgi:hypothetical protein